MLAQTSSAQTSGAGGNQTAQQAAQAAALMAPWTKGDSPGAAVVVIRGGRVLLEEGYGLANIETGEAITPNTVFDLASVSKQFTAAGVMMLADRGRLKLDDPLVKFFPESAAYARGVTVRNLLNHTSGIPDYPQLLIASGQVNANWQRGWETPPARPGFKDVLSLVTAQKGLDFTPGEKWAYSNSNYVILAGIVERVSGKPFPQFLKENIFQPLGMNDTFVQDGTGRTAKGRASRYDRAATGYKAIAATPFDHIYGDGNVHSTVRDLIKWDEALDTGRLVKPSTFREALTPGRLNDGTATDYGFGWVLDNYFGLRMAYHQGGGTGFNTFIMRIPDQRFTVAVLSNFARFNPFIVGRKLARIYLADKLSLPVAVSVSPEVLRQYVGRYRLTPLMEVEVALDGNALLAEAPGRGRMTLLPLSETKFFVKGEEDTIVTFDKDAGGNVTGITVLQVDIPISGKKLEPTVRQP